MQLGCAWGFGIRWATVRENTNVCHILFVTCMPLQTVHLTLSEFLGRVTAQSRKGSYKRSKPACCTSLSSILSHNNSVITLLQPEDELAFGAWKRFCCQQNPAGETAAKGKSAGHSICNCLLLLLSRLDTKFLKTVKEQRFQFSCFKGLWFPELPITKLQVSVSDLGLQDVAGDGQVHWGRLLVLKRRPEIRFRQPNLT